MERWLFIAQRLSAVLLAALVVVHIIGILDASAGELSAAAIAERTGGSVSFALFYGTFAAAAAVHAPIGLRNVLIEWTPLPRGLVNAIAVVFAVAVAWLGGAAVHAVYSA